MHLFRIIRFFPAYSRSLLAERSIIRRSVAKGEGQPTRCGHTLTRCPLPGLGEWLRPFEPCKDRKAKAMKPERDTRSAWIKLRVTPAEKEAIAAKAAAQGQTVTDFIRQRALDYRLRQTPLEKERVRAARPHRRKPQPACPLGQHPQAPCRGPGCAHRPGQP